MGAQVLRGREVEQCRPPHFGDRPRQRTSVNIGGLADGGRQLPRRDRFRTYMEALRNLARTDVPNRAELIERNVDRYLKDEVGGRQRALEWLPLPIPKEKSKRRP